MPIGLMRTYLTMLPRLDAEHQLAAQQVATVGGSMRIELSDAQRWAAAMRRVADGDGDSGRDRRAAAATPETLAAMGIQVVMATETPMEAGHG